MKPEVYSRNQRFLFKKFRNVSSTFKASGSRIQKQLFQRFCYGCEKSHNRRYFGKRFYDATSKHQNPLRRCFKKSKLQHSSVEKKAAAIVEAVRKWSHFLVACRFKVIADQRSIAFMFDARITEKLKM